MWTPHLPDTDAKQQLLFKLPSNISAQEAELVVLLEVIKAHPEPLCVYMDRRYAYGVVTDFMAQWQLRNFLTSAVTSINTIHISTL